MPPSSTPPVLLLLLLLLLLLDPIALCRAKPHHGFGHLGRITRLSNHHPHANQPSTSPLLPHTPAHPSSVPPPPPATPWRHHVFLNFRGPDVRHTFTDHLYYALVRKGIKAFRDDRDLPRGENVTEAIPQAIEDSKLSIVVLSRGYASSEYCLDELVKIMLTMKEKGHHPFPVFYKLSPDEVADQSSGCYKDDFERHKKRYSYERVESWSHALTSIADISGWVLTSDRSEAEMVEKIARNMLWKVHELGRESSVVDASGVNRQFETEKQRSTNSFIWSHPPTRTEREVPVDATRRPVATENSERGTTFIPPEGSYLDEPPPTPNPPAGHSTRTNPSSEENITITVEHHRQATAAASKEADREEEEEEEDDDDKKKRRLWMSRTCTSSCSSSNNQHTHHHHHQEQDQQKLKFIKPEISSQGKKTVRIPKTVAQEEIERFWDHSLIAQQLSNTSPPPHHRHTNMTTTILKEANKLWNISSNKLGSRRWIEVKQVGTTKNGLYIFTFSDKNTLDQVVESSPWCIANATFVMRKWQPNLQLANLVQERSSTIPVWVRLVGVPVEYMNAKGLSYVASVLGKPMYMDRATASKSQLAFAKVCVEMKLSEEGVSTIVVALGDEKDIGGVVVVVVRVFYQWKPCMCISCQASEKT